MAAAAAVVAAASRGSSNEHILLLLLFIIILRSTLHWRAVPSVLIRFLTNIECVLFVRTAEGFEELQSEGFQDFLLPALGPTAE